MDKTRILEGFVAIELGDDRPSTEGGDATIAPFRIELLSGATDRPLAVHINDQEWDHHLLFNPKGAYLVGAQGKEPVLIAPNGIGVFFDDDKCELCIGRGEYECLLFSWKTEEFIAVNKTLKSLRKGGKAIHAAHLDGGVQPLPQLLSEVQKIIEDEDESGAAMLTAFAALTVHMMQGNHDPMILADIPTEAHGPLRDLLEAVRSEPEKRWALKEAADWASYSAFHLSRTFRAIAPYGFPEFVDRARTEMAAKLLLTTDYSVEEIVQRCGFGSHQRLRTSLRDTLGFLPSELRRWKPG